jgi:hypothetical protein
MRHIIFTALPAELSFNEAYYAVEKEACHKNYENQVDCKRAPICPT